jgi:hypothetical protein
LSLVEEGGTLSNTKRIVVDEKSYCSRGLFLLGMWMSQVDWRHIRVDVGGDSVLRLAKSQEQYV